MLKVALLPIRFIITHLIQVTVRVFGEMIGYVVRIERFHLHVIRDQSLAVESQPSGKRVGHLDTGPTE